MSYDTVRVGLTGIITKQGLAESDSIESYETASSNEMGTTFILKPLVGELQDDESETLASHFYDVQTWEIQVGFAKSSMSDNIVRDILHRKKDLLLADLHDKAEWSGYAKMQKYQGWEVLEFPNYLVLVIRVEVLNKYSF